MLARPESQLVGFKLSEMYSEKFEPIVLFESGFAEEVGEFNSDDKELKYQPGPFQSVKRSQSGAYSSAVLRT